MSTPREMKLRIRSVRNIAQVTRALEAVSASRVRKAEQMVRATRPYADKAWQVLRHLSEQPGRDFIHPLLQQRGSVDKIMVVMISSDRGLAGAYNTNIIRFALENFNELPAQIDYVIVGRKGRDVMYRRGANIVADYSDLPAEPAFADVSSIGKLAIEEFLKGGADQVYVVYTDFVNLMRQVPTMKLLLPLQVYEGSQGLGLVTGDKPAVEQQGSRLSYLYEPGEAELIDNIVPRLTELQVYQAILESAASEHAARMVAMRNATDNANELAGALQLEFNKARQKAITSDILDIAGGAEALAKARDQKA
jgi:F-type H+-transporting ATPase subunit gamma